MCQRRALDNSVRSILRRLGMIHYHVSAVWYVGLIESLGFIWFSFWIQEEYSGSNARGRHVEHGNKVCRLLFSFKPLLHSICHQFCLIPPEEH